MSATMRLRLTVPEIAERHPAEWFTLTRQQKLFVLRYTADGTYDRVAATRAAYPKVKEVKSWASRLLANPRVKRVVALHFGTSDARVLLSDVEALLRRSRRRGAKLDLLVAPWLRVAAALEALVVRENSHV